MFGYIIAFGLGYLFGKGAIQVQLPGMPGMLPTSGSTALSTAPVGAASAPWLPAGYTMDAAGNVYDARGVYVSNVGALVTGTQPVPQQ